MALKTVRSAASFSVKYDTVLFPIDVARLLPLLPKAGYVLVDEVQAMPVGPGIVNVEGVIARRLSTVLHLNSGAQVISVRSTSVLQSLEGMTELETLVRDELGVDSRKMSAYFELAADADIEASKSPLEAWQRQGVDLPLMAGLSQVLGTGVSAFGLRLVPSGLVPNGRNWFDIRIEPRVLSPHKLHHINVVYRDQEPDKVEAFARGFEDTVERLVALVEG